MKYLLITLIFLSGFIYSQDDKFNKAMSRYVVLIDSMGSYTFDKRVEIKNAVDRIAGSEKERWLAQYYGALFNIVCGFTDTTREKTDAFLDIADEYLKNAENLKSQESEIVTLQAYSALARMVVNPFSRWQAYGTLFNKKVEEALELNPKNPRALALKGVSLYNMPEPMGGSKAKGLVIIQEAYDNFLVEKPESDLHPNWGISMLNQYLKFLNENKEEK
ncbi:MAG: hypothetical protein IAE91_04535 [Ignavibacteriaceae bacterium]|nr:hypothetical protein [Ignavibacteriaceae bacterium]